MLHEERQHSAQGVRRGQMVLFLRENGPHFG